MVTMERALFNIRAPEARCDYNLEMSINLQELLESDQWQDNEREALHKGRAGKDQ